MTNFIKRFSLAEPRSVTFDKKFLPSTVTARVGVLVTNGLAGAGPGRRSSSASRGSVGRPTSRASGGDEFGRNATVLHPVSFTRELAFGGGHFDLNDDDDEWAAFRRLKKCSAPCLGRLALTAVVLLLGVAVYVVRYYEKLLEQRLRDEYTESHPMLKAPRDANDTWLNYEQMGYG